MMGGLINELEQKIQACNQLQNDYECNINFLTNRNDNYYNVYKNTYNFDWLKNNYKYIKPKSLYDYRQSLIDNIGYNNNLIQDYKKRLEKSINISTFLQKIYFYINFNIKNYKSLSIIGIKKINPDNKMAWRFAPCPNCGRPFWICRGSCRSGRNEDFLNEENDKIEMNIQCYAVPNFYIFSSNDPDVIPKSIEKINDVMKELREIYWDFMEDAGVPLNYESSSKGWHKLLELDEERRKAFCYASHLNEHLHQILAPLFIVQKIDGKIYNEYMDTYENANQYFNMMKNNKEEDQFYIDDYFKKITNLHNQILKCFEKYGVKSMEKNEN